MAIPIDNTNTPFQLASDFVNFTNASVFLTGKAGTGKTTFLKHIKENEVKNTVVVAPTGVAAINAGGTTIHSFFQLPFSPYIPVSKGFGGSDAISDKHSLISRLRLTNERKEVMQKLELLIIDEISMVRCDVLDAIDTVLRHVRSQHSVPFGGVQVLLIGDMYQLPPVIKPEEWEILAPYYKSEYFFNSLVIESQPPVYVELNKIYRQSAGAFINVLNEVRNNALTEAGQNLLHTRYLPNLHPGREENYITLTTHNSKADAINFKALNELAGKMYNFDATIEGEFYEKSFPAEINLKLKIGTQVMFLKNDIEKVRRYFNGKIGVVDKIDGDKIFVLCEGETNPIEVKKEKWKNIRYNLDKTSNQIAENEIGSFTQFPLRLAWAITIHKSQGLTFEKAIIDAGEAFSSGQVYVALSRCTSLEGIILHSRINNNSLRSDRRIADFAATQATSETQLQLLNKARRGFQENCLINLFNLSEIRSNANDLLSFIIAQETIFNKEAIVWAETIHNSVTQMETTALKFLPILNQLFINEALPENNEALQKRLIGGSTHFATALLNCKRQINSCSAVTDSKTVATDGNKLLFELNLSVSNKEHLFIGCKNGFLVNDYLTHKRNFIKSYLSVNLYAGKTNHQKIDSPYPELYKQLRDKRDEICEQKDIPIYLVANSASLDEMARYLPQTFEELNKISGFGKIKTEKLGPAFLSIINRYCEQHNLHTNMETIPLKKGNDKKRPEVKTDTKTTSFLLFKEGKTIAEIAMERSFTQTTIEGHLAFFVGTKEMDINDLISLETQLTIKKAIEKYGREDIKLLFQKLTDVSYNFIKLVLNSMPLHNIEKQ